MKNVKVLLREDVDKLGRCGEIVRVAAGFARNYLLPRSLAIEATPENARLMERRRKRLDAEALARSEEILARVAVLSGVRLSTIERADEQGHLYGSVNAPRIVELLAKAGHTVTERDVRLDSPIRSIGEHKVRVHVFGTNYAEVLLAIDAAATA
jgi:large subunit ribosomal protein L9